MKMQILTAAAIAALTATTGVGPAAAADQAGKLEGMYYMGERHPIPPAAQPLGATRHRTVMVDGESLAAKDLLGRPVVTPSGTPFGEITAVRGQDASEKNLVIRIDEAHWARGMNFPTRDTASPLVSGNGRAAVSAGRTHLFNDGRSLVVERSSLRPIGS